MPSVGLAFHVSLLCPGRNISIPIVVEIPKLTANPLVHVVTEHATQGKAIPEAGLRRAGGCKYSGASVDAVSASASYLELLRIAGGSQSQD